MAEKKSDALIYLDANIVLDLIFPSRNNRCSQTLYDTIKSDRKILGVISSFCTYEVLEQIQLQIYQKRALESGYSLEQAKKFQGGEFTNDIFLQGNNRLEEFLDREKSKIIVMDPEGSRCWTRARIIAQTARFETGDLTHLAMALGVGACALATNDQQFYESMKQSTSRRLTLTPVLCNPRLAEGKIRKILVTAIRRAEQKQKEKDLEKIERLMKGAMTSESESHTSKKKNKSYEEQLKDIEAIFKRKRINSQ